MSYRIKNTGGVLQIGMLQDLNGSKVNIATNKSAIQAVWKDADGEDYATITIAENAGDNYDCLLTVIPATSLPLGTHTIRLESSADVILPRNIELNVLSEAAYNNLYSVVLPAREGDTSIFGV